METPQESSPPPIPPATPPSTPTSPPSGKLGLTPVWIVLGGMGLLIFVAALAGLVVPVILRARKSADRAQATRNARCMSLALFSFEEEFGTFPSPQILRDYPERFKNTTGSESANDLLGMLVDGGYTDSEVVFSAKGGSPTRREPDNVFDTPATLLEPGECGFGYVMLAGGRAMTADDNGERPLLVTPLMPGSAGADLEFNPQPYSGKAVYLRIDMAVKQCRIDDSGKVKIRDGHTLFKTGPDTVWGDDVPDVRPPE